MTLGWVVLCFALFRCSSIGDFGQMLARLTGGGGRTTLHASLWLVPLLLGCAQLLFHQQRERLRAWTGIMPAPAYGFALGVGVAIALFLTPLASKPFICFQF